MKRMKKLLGILLALTLALSMFALPAMAEEPATGTEHKYESNDVVAGSDAYLQKVDGTEFIFQKYLIVPDGIEVPNVTFAFTITDTGTAISLDTSDNPVMQVGENRPTANGGGQSGTPTIAADQAVFGPRDTANLKAAAAVDEIDVKRTAAQRYSTKTEATGVQLGTGEKFVKKAVKVDFSGVTFVEPGIYRYIITETADTAHEAAGIMHDNDPDRILDVYVTDNGNGKLILSSYVLHTGKDQADTEGHNSPDVAIGTNMGSADVSDDGARLDNKTDGFTNEYKPYDLVFKKEVYGNQASRDKYFEFTVKVTGLNDSDNFVVSLANDGNDATTDGNANATSGTNNATITAYQGKPNLQSVSGAQLEAGVKFYLQHGQYIAIRGLPANATYAVDENPEDYKKVVAGSGQASYKTIEDFQNVVTGVLSVQDAKMRSDGTTDDSNPDRVVYTSILNVREGIIPTGIITVIGPAVALILLAAAGLIVVFVSKNRKKSGAR